MSGYAIIHVKDSVQASSVTPTFYIQKTLDMLKFIGKGNHFTPGSSQGIAEELSQLFHGVNSGSWICFSQMGNGIEGIEEEMWIYLGTQGAQLSHYGLGAQVFTLTPRPSPP